MPRLTSDQRLAAWGEFIQVLQINNLYATHFRGSTGRYSGGQLEDLVEHMLAGSCQCGSFLTVEDPPVCSVSGLPEWQCHEEETAFDRLVGTYR